VNDAALNGRRHRFGAIHHLKFPKRSARRMKLQERGRKDTVGRDCEHDNKNSADNPAARIIDPALPLNLFKKRFSPA